MSAPTPVVYWDRNEIFQAVCCGSFKKSSETEGPAAQALVRHLADEHGVTIVAERLPYGYERRCERCPIVANPECDECGGLGCIIEVHAP